MFLQLSQELAPSLPLSAVRPVPLSRLTLERASLLALTSHFLYVHSDFDEENVTDSLKVFNQSEQRSPYIWTHTQRLQGFTLRSSSLAFRICILSPLNLLLDFLSSKRIQTIWRRKHRKSAKLPWRRKTKLCFLSVFCLFVFLPFLSFCLFVFFLSFCLFVFFLYLCPCITLMICLKGLKSQKSLFVSKFWSGNESVSESVSAWPRSGIELPGQLKIQHRCKGCNWTRKPSKLMQPLRLFDVMFTHLPQTSTHFGFEEDQTSSVSVSLSPGLPKGLPTFKCDVC